MVKHILISYATRGISARDLELTSGPQWSPAKTTMLYDGIVSIELEQELNLEIEEQLKVSVRS